MKLALDDASGVNQFNGSTQYNYAVKHNPMTFFTDTNGGDDPTPANPLSHQYAPLQQLFIDLATSNVGSRAMSLMTNPGGRRLG